MNNDFCDSSQYIYESTIRYKWASYILIQNYEINARRALHFVSRPRKKEEQEDR